MFRINPYGGASHMIRCDSFKNLKNERGVSMHFPITHLYSPTIFETRNMMMGSVIHLKGVSFYTKDNEILNQIKRRWHQAVLGLGENFSIYVTVHRRKQETSLSGEFKNDFLREINQRYQSYFKKKTLYVNDMYLTILSRGLVIAKMDPIVNWLSRLSSKSIQKSREWKRQEQVKIVENSVSQLMVSLSGFKPTLLGARDQSLKHSELLSFLSLFLNGGEKCQTRFFYPSDHLGRYLCSRRLFFGKAIEFQGYDDTKARYAAMVSVKKYAPVTQSSMMDRFLQINSEYISTNSLLIASKEMAQRLIKRHRYKLENVNDPAKSQINELSLAQDELASNRIVMGFHHNTCMLIENNMEKLEQAVAETIKHYADQGFIAIRESIGQEAAFWAQIPGNTKMIARSALISSQNFVDFCSLHNYQMGYCDQNHLGGAVTILKTPSNTPYFFNFHAKGNKNNPSKGHTTMIGGNGSGKTVTMAFLDAQASRYQGRTFVFDRDRGLEIYLRACGGYYGILSPEHSDTINFNPFQLPDTSINRKFCREWMSQLVKEEDEVVLPADLAELMGQCVDYVFEALPIQDRRLTNAAKLLPITFPRWAHLRAWLRSDGIHPEGQYAYLFDNAEDSFQMQQKMGFDMTHFLDKESKNVLVAVTMYLFHRLEQSLDGRLTSVLLDEGWQYLDNPYWMQKLQKWLPTLRKLNCHLVLATQSPSSVVESPIRNMILDNAATHIYFANPQAKREQYQQGFNLTESEYRCIRQGDPENYYFLLKQGHESNLCQLDLSMISDILPIFSANRSTLLMLETLRKHYGDDPKNWLTKFRHRVMQ